MNLIVCPDEKAWLLAIDSWFRENLTATKAKRIFLPAGETPRPLYRDWQTRQPAYLRGLTFVQLDEITGGEKKNIFRHFFQETLPAYSEQFEFIDDAEKGAELAVLGLGTNGHVAFHEPGLPRRFYSGCVRLDKETRERLKLSDQAQATTYGADAFMRSKAILMIVRGESKRAILKKIFAPNCDLPAAWLMRHPHLTIITDFAT